MQKLARLKPYKNASSMATVNRIRQILFDHDIFVIEAFHKKEPITGVCSCRIILADEDLRELNIGSNGKGMDARYALASAYAEFMERLQNGATLWKVLGVPNSVPGASHADEDKLKAGTAQLLHFAFGNMEDIEGVLAHILEGLENDKVITFREYRTNKPVSFPAQIYNKMTGSNGMAAGNTVLEAIIQGLSEVFERAVLQELFLHRITPPTIDENVFADTEVLRRLKRLKQKDISYRILDCSLSQGFPVLGLLIEKDRKYHLHFGADPSPITALERCLTETFQGRMIGDLPLYPPLEDTEELLTLFKNEEKAYTDSTGRVPIWILSEEPTYCFEGFAHPVTVSDEDDMDYYLHLLDKIGKQLYVMQYDGLGFPAVRVYVPGITENHCPMPKLCINPKLPENIRLPLRRLPLLTDDGYAMLANELQKWLHRCFQINAPGDYPSGDFIGLKYVLPPGNFTGKYWEDRLLLAAIYLRGGLVKQGEALLSICLQDGGFSEKERALLRLRLHSRLLTFTVTDWPQCPDCSSCGAKRLCFRYQVDAFNAKLTDLLCM